MSGGSIVIPRSIGRHVIGDIHCDITIGGRSHIKGIVCARAFKVTYSTISNGEICYIKVAGIFTKGSGNGEGSICRIGTGASERDRGRSLIVSTAELSGGSIFITRSIGRHVISDIHRDIAIGGRSHVKGIKCSRAFKVTYSTVSDGEIVYIKVAGIFTKDSGNQEGSIRRIGTTTPERDRGRSLIVSTAELSGGSIVITRSIGRHLISDIHCDITIGGRSHIKGIECSRAFKVTHSTIINGEICFIKVAGIFTKTSGN